MCTRVLRNVEPLLSYYRSQIPSVRASALSLLACEPLETKELYFSLNVVVFCLSHTCVVPLVLLSTLLKSGFSAVQHTLHAQNKFMRSIFLDSWNFYMTIEFYSVRS